MTSVSPYYISIFCGQKLENGRLFHLYPDGFDSAVRTYMKEELKTDGVYQLFIYSEDDRDSYIIEALVVTIRDGKCVHKEKGSWV